MQKCDVFEIFKIYLQTRFDHAYQANLLFIDCFQLFDICVFYYAAKMIVTLGEQLVSKFPL